jgi:tight adherence protein B
VLKQRVYSSIPLVQAMLKRFGPARTAAVELTRASVKLSVSQYLLLRLLTGAMTAFLMVVVTGSLLPAPLGVILGVMLPRIYLVVRAHRRKKAFEAQLAEAIDLLVGALRAGYGFLQAIEAVTRDIDDPMREELQRAVEEIALGISPADALAAINDRIDSYDFGLLATAISVQRSVGGNLAEVLENIANTVRERRRIRAEVHAITTGPRVSSYVLGLIPLGLLVFFSTTNQNYRDVMFHSPIGKAMLIFATVWSLLGLFFSRKVARVEY